MPQAPKTLRTRKTVRVPDRRPSSSQRGYTQAWRDASAAWLVAQFAAGICSCAACGRIVGPRRRDVHVDHVEDHKGDMAKFWDSSRWQMLCPSCHSRKTARENRR